MSWRELPPELARADLLGLVYLGTLRPDGRPRIGPAEAHVFEGELLVGVMPRSLRARPRPRPALHPPERRRRPDSGEPELKLYCRAAAAAGDPPGVWWSGREDAAVYALEIDEAVTSWSPAPGARTATRPYP